MYEIDEIRSALAKSETMNLAGIEYEVIGVTIAEADSALKACVTLRRGNSLASLKMSLEIFDGTAKLNV